MKRNHSPHHHKERRWLIPTITISLLLSITLVLTISLNHTNPSSTSSSSPLDNPNFIPFDRDAVVSGEFSLPNLPIFAYLLTGTKGDVARVKRVLQAVYHPRNYYLIHFDLEASDSERLELARYVRSEAVIRAFDNVMVVGKADLITFKGPTMIASTLHGIALLLKRVEHWDWFINLSADDYPLMSQDDLLHIFSFIPRDLNFIEHTSNMGWKEYQRAKPIIIDPGLYHSKKSGVYWAKEKRSVPSSFKLFTGSEWFILTKPFLEFCIRGWDNLPRTLLMYYTNFLSSHEGYFHTVICNHKDYQNTTVNHDLHYIKWDNPPKQDPISLTSEHFNDMVESGAPFARKFNKDDPVLDRIDKELLRRSDSHFTPGGWCIRNHLMGKDPCAAAYRNPVVVKPTVSSKRLEKLVVKLLDSQNFRPKQCK